MKNNTKIRLHLSKQLFESLTKQVIAEAKGDMSGGAYTEAVKAPKGEKKADREVKAEAKPASSALKSPATPTTTKGASKQQVATALMQTGRDLNKNPQANLQSTEGGLYLQVAKKLLDIADDKDNAAMMLSRVDKLIDTLIKNRGAVQEMETITAEDSEVKEIAFPEPIQQLMTDPELAKVFGMSALKLLSGGVALGVAVKQGMKALAQRAIEKDPEAFAGKTVDQVAQEMGGSATGKFQKTAGGSGEGGLLGK